MSGRVEQEGKQLTPEKRNHLAMFYHVNRGKHRCYETKPKMLKIKNVLIGCGFIGVVYEQKTLKNYILSLKIQPTL